MLEIAYVVMRYSNGFTIGWNDGAHGPEDGAQDGLDKMLASREPH